MAYDPRTTMPDGKDRTLRWTIISERRLEPDGLRLGLRGPRQNTAGPGAKLPAGSSGPSPMWPARRAPPPRQAQHGIIVSQPISLPPRTGPAEPSVVQRQGTRETDRHLSNQPSFRALPTRSLRIARDADPLISSTSPRQHLQAGMRLPSQIACAYSSARTSRLCVRAFNDGEQTFLPARKSFTCALISLIGSSDRLAPLSVAPSCETTKNAPRPTTH